MWRVQSQSRKLAAVVLMGSALLALPRAASAQGPSYSTTLGVGALEVELSLQFEQAIGASAQNLGVSARLVSASELLGRLPAGVSVPSGLPLLVTIEPPAEGGLTFTGVATIELHTHDLAYSPSLLLFKSSGGGPFLDITQSVGMGSHRVRGSSGGFSEFLILADTRLISGVVDGKFQRVAALLDAHEDTMPAELADELAGHLLAAQTAWSLGDALGAIDDVNAFTDAVKAASGSSIPDVWRSSRDLTNVAGELRSAAGTLRFSLSLAGG
jgi:hypothetical protein